MPIYKELNKMAMIKFEDIVSFVEDNGIEGVFGNLGYTQQEQEYCFELLYERFFFSEFRYTDITAAMLALRRTARFAFKELLEKEKLYNDLIATQVDDLMKQRQQIRNLVEKPNDPLVEAATVAIQTLSTNQETITTLMTKIEAIQDKWRVIQRNIYDNLYKHFVPLFTNVPLGTDDIIIYPKED